jgi:hypothetical protein
MGPDQEIELIAHLMRRAGFGSHRDELEVYATRGYEATVEELLHTEDQPPFDEDLLYRYFPYFRMGTAIATQQSHWTLRMISTRRPL